MLLLKYIPPLIPTTKPQMITRLLSQMFLMLFQSKYNSLYTWQFVLRSVKRMRSDQIINFQKMDRLLTSMLTLKNKEPDLNASVGSILQGRRKSRVKEYFLSSFCVSEADTQKILRKKETSSSLKFCRPKSSLPWRCTFLPGEYQELSGVAHTCHN